MKKPTECSECAKLRLKVSMLETTASVDRKFHVMKIALLEEVARDCYRIAENLRVALGRSEKWLKE